MCKLVEITRDAVPSNILIEFERDAVYRSTKLVLVNRNRKNIECEGIHIRCFDDGRIVIVAAPQELINGIPLGHVPSSHPAR